MAKLTYKADTIVKNSIHRPFIDDNGKPLVLYKKISGYNKGEDNIESKYSESPLYGKYLEQSESTYNSPRNIRRLFITGERIVVQYFTSPLVKGKRSGITWSDKGYVGKSISEIIKSMVQYEQAARVNPVAVKKMDNVQIEGNCLSCVSYPLVCSNIEEIYIDYNMFELAMMVDGTELEVASILGTSVDNIHKVRSHLASNNDVEGKEITGEPSRIPEALFAIANKSKDTTFKRLRTVGVIKGLNNILHDVGLNKCEELGNERWCDNAYNSMILKQYGGAMLISRIARNECNYMTFTSSEGIYQFDKDILSEFFETTVRKYETNKILQRDSVDKVEVSSESVTSELEEKWNDLNKLYGEEKAKMIFGTMLSTTSFNDIDEALKLFTSSGRDKIETVFNLRNRRR